MNQRDEEPGNRLRMNPEWAAVLEAVYPRRVAVGWGLLLLGCAAALVWLHEDTASILGLLSDSARAVLLWVVVLYLLNWLIYWTLGHYVSTILFLVITGRVYARNHLSYRVAGGFHLPFVTNLVAQAGAFAYYVWSADRSPDPIASMRSFWGYIGLVAAAQLALTLVISALAFAWFVRKHGRLRVAGS